MITLRLPLFLLAAVACGPAEHAVPADPSGLLTEIDSTADTVYARMAGEVPGSAHRRLVREMAVAPDADDTSLFTDVFEFDVGWDGAFWVFDRPSNVLLIFNADGTLRQRTGRQGAGPGEYNSNNGMVMFGDSGAALWDARNGRIWLRVPAPSEVIPADELPVTGDTLRPVLTFRTPVVSEVYAPTGRFLGRLAFPPRTALMEADGNQVWALVRDADDLPAVTRFRIEPALP